MATWRGVVTLNNGVLGGTGTNTWHIRTIAGPTAASNAEILFEHLREFYDDRKGAFPLGTTVSWNGVFAGVGADEGESLETAPWSVLGTGNGNSLPPANCIVVSWSGVSGDRSKDGRTFFGPITVNANAANGTLEDAVVTDFRNAAADLISDSKADGNGAFGVWSRQEQILRDFDESHVSDKFAVLRSRRD